MQTSSQTMKADGATAHDHRTAKVVELVSSSPDGFQEAVANALEDARQSTRGITGAHVEGMSVQCEDGRIVAYKVNLKLVFGVERQGETAQGGGSNAGSLRGERPKPNK